MSDRVIKVAAVGIGWVATHRHLPVMDGDPRYEVVGVIDKDGAKAHAVAKERGYRRSSDACDLGSIAWLGEVDAVTISSPPMEHARHIEQALDLGKHVLTEKPFAMTVAEGERLLAKAREKGLALAIVHNFQFARSMLRALADLEGGRLGVLRSVAATQFGNPSRRLPSWYESLPLGLFYDESPHLLYLLDRVCDGDIGLMDVHSVPGSAGKRTPAHIMATYRSGRGAIPLTIQCHFESPVSEWHVLLLGERALGLVDIFRDIYIRLPNDGIHDARSVLRTSVAATVQHWAQHIASGLPYVLGRLRYGNDHVFARFADAVRGEKDRLAPISGERALAVLRMQHDIVEKNRLLWERR